MGIDSSFINKVKEGVTVELIVTIIKWSILATVPVLVWLFWSFLNTKITIPAYFPVISFVSGGVIFFLIIKGINYFKKTYKDYRKDKFFGIIWKWDYLGGRKDVSTMSIIPICPICNSEMAIFDYDNKKGNSKMTSLLCRNHECEYSKIDFDILPTFTGSEQTVRNQVVFKVDKELRDRGLKR